MIVDARVELLAIDAASLFLVVSELVVKGMFEVLFLSEFLMLLGQARSIDD